jgi:hypothetical protein
VYNVFKRPMFKRGGTAQGSGIMSHVEARPVARVKAAVGFPTFGLSQEIDQASLDRFRQAEAERKARIGQPFDIRGPKLTDPNYGSRIQQFGTYNRYLDDAEKQRQMATSNQQEEEGIMQIAMQQEYARKAQEEADRLAKEQDLLLKNKTKTDNIPPKSAKEQVGDEATFIKDLLKDEGYNKAELALILAESLATPGGFNKKLETARKLGADVARTQRKEDKAVTLEAYKRYKDRESEMIKAGKLGDTEAFVNKRIELGLKNATKTKDKSGNILYDGLTENQYREKVYSNRLGEDKYSESLGKVRLGQEGPKISTAIQKINELQGKVEKGEQLSKDEISTLATKIQFVKGYSKLPGFSDVFAPQLAKPEYLGGYSIGGRVKRAEGGMGEMENVNSIVTSDISSDTTETPVKPVMKLSYQELRSRLPQEITNDIVQLLSNSEQALQDFAYLQTQQDVGNFNVKYGVNLVLPPQS